MKTIYGMQIEYSGRGSISSVAHCLAALSAKRLFLVSGKMSFQTSGAKAAIEGLISKYQVTYFNRFTSNPKFEEALAGSKLFKESKSDTIIAIGGGSAIDIAKSISAFQTQPNHELELAIGSLGFANKKLPPIIAIPTTAGTGSEATHFAVIYVDGSKYSIASTQLLPRISILDATFTDNLPTYITACTGFDAFCQAIESYWAVGANNKSLSYSESAIRILMEDFMERSDPPSQKTREMLLKASNLAGKAINISKTTAPHALSYGITTYHGLPHGHAVAATLGAFLEFHNDVVKGARSDVPLIDNFNERHLKLCRILGFTESASLISQWATLRSKCGLPIDATEEIFATSESRNQIISAANPERLSNHPFRLKHSNLHDILELLA